MRTSVADRQSPRFGSLLLLVILTSACISTPEPSVVEYFDELTVTNITRSSTNVNFIARRGDISVVGGDMITMGPVNTALSSKSEFYLWLGFWTTLDRFRLQSGPPAPPDEIVVEFDDQTIRLQRRTLYTPADGPASRIYPAPSPGVVDAYYGVTLEQLHSLRGAHTLRIVVTDQSDRVTIYEAQDSIAPMLDSFIEFTG